MNTTDFKPGLILDKTMTLSGFKPGLILHPNARTFPRKEILAVKDGVATPASLDARSRLLSSSNQVTTSECVTFAFAGYAEFQDWKYKGITSQIDPHPAYVQAKKIDGIAGDGTTLEAGLQAFQDLGLISPVEAASIREVNDLADVRRALHLYDVMVIAMEISESWMDATPDGWIKPGGASIGGHAVLLCGYDLGASEPYYQFQNSWGTGQGWRGFNRISPELFDNQFRYGFVWDSKKV